MTNANLVKRRLICCFVYWRLSRYKDTMLVWISKYFLKKWILKANTTVAIFSDTIFKHHMLAQNPAVHKELILVTNNLQWNQCIAQPRAEISSKAIPFRVTLPHTHVSLWVLLDMKCIIHFSRSNIRLASAHDTDTQNLLLFRRQEFDSTHSAPII